MYLNLGVVFFNADWLQFICPFPFWQILITLFFFRPLFICANWPSFSFQIEVDAPTHTLATAGFPQRRFLAKKLRRSFHFQHECLIYRDKPHLLYRAFPYNVHCPSILCLNLKMLVIWLNWIQYFVFFNLINSIFLFNVRVLTAMRLNYLNSILKLIYGKLEQRAGLMEERENKMTEHFMKATV